MNARALAWLLPGLLASCMGVDSSDPTPPHASLAFRLTDTAGSLRSLAARTCSLQVSFRTGTGSWHDTVLPYGSGHWLSPSVPASEDWQISLLGIDSTGHALWTGSSSGTYKGTATTSTALWTDVPVSAVAAADAPVLSLVSGTRDLPLTLNATSGDTIQWSSDSLSWATFPTSGMLLDRATTLWARAKAGGIRPRPNSVPVRLDIRAKQVDRPTYSGSASGLDFPLTLSLDSVAGTTLHWSLDTGRSWGEGRLIPMAGPGLLRAFATRVHQPGSDTLTLSLDGTVTPRTMTDTRDGKVYRVVRIGTQVWMAQNLDFVTDSSWAVPSSECAIGTAPSGCTGLLGRYYSWSAAMSLPPEADTAISVSIVGKDICPSNWHLPTPGEWQTLEQIIGTGAVEDLAVVWPGSHAIYTGKDSWGFSAYPVAYRTLDGSISFFAQSVFWSSEPQAVGMASAWGWPPYLKLGILSFYRSNGLPVRCLRDEP